MTETEVKGRRENQRRVKGTLTGQFSWALHRSPERAKARGAGSEVEVVRHTPSPARLRPPLNPKCHFWRMGTVKQASCDKQGLAAADRTAAVSAVTATPSEAPGHPGCAGA